MTTRVVYPIVEVTSDGSPVVVLETQVVTSLRSPVSNANVRVAHTEGPFDGTEIIDVSLGDQTGTTQNFSGKLNIDSANYAPGQASFSAQGSMFLLQEATGIVDPAADPIPADPADPPYQGPTFAKKWENATAGEIITDILALYGLTQVYIEDSADLFGTIEPVRLRSDQAGLELIQELDTITGFVTFNGPDGSISRVAYTGLPGATAAFTFTQGTNIRNIQRQRNTGKVYNSVTVNGRTGILAPSGEYYDISASRVGTSPYIPTPPGTREFTFSSDLIDTEELAGTCAERMLASLNRRTETITLTVTPGNKRLQPNMTVAIEASAVNIDSTIFSRIVETRQVYGSDYTTQLVLEGALGSEGTDPNQTPIAMIAYVIEVENTVDGLIYVIMLDFTSSYDLDGYIVDYLATATVGTINPIGIGDKATLIISGTWPTPEPQVTLRVTDDHGKYGYKTLTIHKTTKNTFVRPLWAAVASDLLLSLDGQITWLLTTVPAYYLPDQAGDAYQLAASSSGHLYRVILNLTYTEPADVNNVRSLFISRDRNGKETGVAWAGGSDGKVWRSPDYGVTWFHQGTIFVGETVYAITESPFSPGDMYGLAGRKIVHSYDAGVTWETLYTHPNPSVVAYRWAAGITADDVSLGWAGYYGPDMLADASHLIERNGTINIDTATPADKPLRFTGLVLSLDSARLLAVDVSTTPEGRAWIAAADVSGNLTKMTAYDDSIFGLPSHISRDGKFPIVWGISDSCIWKSVDEFVSFTKIYELVSPRVGQMISYGALRLAPVASGDLLFYAQKFGTTEAHLIRLSNLGWADLGLAPINGDNPFGVFRFNRLWRSNAGSIFSWSWDSFPTVAKSSVYRSTDNGLTWSTLASGGLDSAIDIVQADDDIMYAYGNADPVGSGGNYTADILKSVDDGVTWTYVATYFYYGGGLPFDSRIAVDRGDSSRLAMHHVNGIKISTDGGLTFATYIPIAGVDAFFASVQSFGTNKFNYPHGGGDIIKGTFSPATASSSVAYGSRIYDEGTKLINGESYFLPYGNHPTIYSTDDGVTWSDHPTYPVIGGIVQNEANDDLYITTPYVTGGSNPVTDPFKGLIFYYAGGTGTAEDLTQEMVTALGSIFTPMYSCVLIGNVI